MKQSNSGRLRLAVIGMGARVTHMAKLMCEADPDVRVVRVVDPQPDAARARAAEAKLPDADAIRFDDSIDALLNETSELDGLLIGTQCHLHAPLAVAVAATGLPLFLEKPVAISWDQWHDLASAFKGRGANVVVSFPLRRTAHVTTAVEIIRSGRLGAVNQIQAINNVPYGGVYFGQWYRDYEKTGGLWLQKATHDLDYVNCLMDAAELGARPVSVAAMHTRAAYGGSFPPDHRCSRCDVTDTCRESPLNLTLRGSDGGMLNYETPTPDSDHACAFSRNILHQDAGSAIVMYDNGVHAAYSQNFLPRQSAGQRGATVIGYDATLRFDWQSDMVTIIDHHRTRVDRVEVAAAGAHGGGDSLLARNFVDVVRGVDVSRTPLDQGLVSAAMCLAARDAAAGGMTQPVPHPDGRAATALIPSPRGPVEPPIVPLTLSGRPANSALTR
ncbi:MAG: Oxidoreductase [Phycisphaerales bacterium]|nr:Oxidoreductase [Phycisphaerales bacterium]